MLAQQGTIEGAIVDNGRMAAEYKYDGSRFQFHKKEKKVSCIPANWKM
jgi:DNA ligase-1